MKIKLLIFALLALHFSFSLPADTNTVATAEELIADTVAVINNLGWTAQDVVDAIASLRGLYLRDTATKEGRKRWHGNIVSTSIDTNALTKTTVYEDGEVFVDPFTVPSAAKPATTLSSSGIPAALAAVRERRAAEMANTNTVFVVVGSEKSK